MPVLQAGDDVGERQVVIAELVTDDELQCSEGVLRQWERSLLNRIFHYEHIGDDTPVEAQFCLGWQISDTGYGVEEVPHQGYPRQSDQAKLRSYHCNKWLDCCRTS